MVPIHTLICTPSPRKPTRPHTLTLGVTRSAASSQQFIEITHNTKHTPTFSNMGPGNSLSVLQLLIIFTALSSVCSVANSRDLFFVFLKSPVAGDVRISAFHYEKKKFLVLIIEEKSLKMLPECTLKPQKNGRQMKRIPQCSMFFKTYDL